MRYRFELDGAPLGGIFADRLDRGTLVLDGKYVVIGMGSATVESGEHIYSIIIERAPVGPLAWADEIATEITPAPVPPVQPVDASFLTNEE